MTLKPPTKTLPKLVMKEWPGLHVSYDTDVTAEQVAEIEALTAPEFATGGWVTVEALSDFTRVVEETGILDQGRSQKDGPPSNESEATKSDRRTT